MKWLRMRVHPETESGESSGVCIAKKKARAVLFSSTLSTTTTSRKCH